ncbi:MAG: ATP-binding protein [Gammaproteobacteria bacterium]|nr:ATP-binding protein [Gammaproteobacteria bacterium]
MDITKLKEMEASLIDAKEKAEVANRAKTEFLASMSHDMKTPLAGIVTTAEVIVGDKTAPDRDKQYAAIIAASGKQLASFFTSCLDLSKMEMQEWASKIETFSLKQLVNDVAALFAPQALSKNLPLNLEYDDTLPPAVEGHRESLYRVLLNLVGNALKFTEKGSITLRTVRSDLINNQQVNVIFQVQDTGIGIPEDKHKIIFEKLQRLKPSYESQVEGSGIGLYIVDQYVKRLGGAIQVKSKVGKGSTFIITIPLKISADKAIVLPEITPSKGGQAPASKIQSSINISSNLKVETKNTSNLPRVLVVEDTEVIQFVTKSLLNDAGFSVDIASTGEEAVEMFEPGKYGLIYMDLGLPKMTGYETAKAIRSKEKSKNEKNITPIVALTGHGAVDVQAFCGEAGMQGILSKPLSRDQAEQVWEFYVKHIDIHVPGLTVLASATSIKSDENSLDIPATAKLVGSQAVADKLVSEFIKDLKKQFLSDLKVFITEHKYEELRFLLHKMLGSLVYVKAPKLQKKNN